MKKPFDLRGQKFGRLTPVEIVGKSKTGKIAWRCECDCGSSTVTSASSLRGGRTKSCGCFRREISAERQRTHGEAPRNGSTTPEYRTWLAMKRRCSNAKVLGWENYGGRGISVCDSWASSFDAFLADMGRRPSAEYSIERIDNNVGYSPDNCKWATRSEQRKNQRRMAA